MNSFLKNTTEIRVVIIEKVNNEYHYKKIPLVQKTWKNSQHPYECHGKCDLQPGVFSNTCITCGWDDF